MTTSTDNAITSLVTVLDRCAADAAAHTRQALDTVEGGNRNGAIGALLPVEAELEDGLALLRTILSLHRRR